jgi:CheY-like chemotaxis protein
MGSTAGAQADVGAGGGPLVLVIDDDPDSLAICARALKAAGYRTLTAASGAEGLAHLEAQPPALVVLDLVMPGTDGFATARAIRARPASAAVPILMFTALPRDAELRARAAGGTGFLTKPVEPQRLLAEVRRLCGEGRKG